MKIPNLHLPTFNSWVQPWWIKVHTQTPSCIYYFGPFGSEKEAGTSQRGYVEDLVQEGALDISTEIEQVCPIQITIHEDF
jgi:hypothetical protein